MLRIRSSLEMTLEYMGRCGWVLCKDDALSSVRDLGVCGFQYPRQASSHSLWLPQDDWVTVDGGAGGECASCSHMISTVWELRFLLTQVSHGRPGSAVTPVQVSCSVVFGSLQSHRLEHARLPCPSPIPGAYANSRPSSW